MHRGVQVSLFEFIFIILRKIIPFANSFQKRELWRCLARCNKNVAKADVPNDDRESQAIYLLEQISYFTIKIFLNYL